MAKKILVVVAHPDDEVLGCGGTIAKHKDDEVCCLILGDGVSSRFSSSSMDGVVVVRRDELQKNAQYAADILGIDHLIFKKFPDNRFDTIPLLDIVKEIEVVKKQVEPDIVYTHHKGDLNIDHRITFEAVLTACRPMKGETAKELYSFEVPSSTEWAFNYSFKPNVFVDISRTIETKFKALACYKSEIREFPHPRSPDVLRATAIRWGSMVGLEYAEAFELIRGIE